MITTFYFFRFIPDCSRFVSNIEHFINTFYIDQLLICAASARSGFASSAYVWNIYAQLLRQLFR
jgi:hypothetical protein